jgi:hypothetical protein
MKRSYIIACCFLFILTLTGASCSWFGAKKTVDTPTTTTDTTSQTTATTNLATTNLTNVAATSVDDLITSNYNIAKSKAQNWQSDAVLVNITVKLARNLAVNQATETYVFGSAQDGKNWFSFSISEQSSKYIRAVIPKEDYLGTSIKPINSSYWKMNYPKAFQLAEQNGGSTFRTNNTNSDVVTTLSQSEPKGWLWWQVEYKSADTGNKLVVKINPSDGTVVDESGNPLSTSASTPTTTTTQ